MQNARNDDRNANPLRTEVIAAMVWQSSGEIAPAHPGVDTIQQLICDAMSGDDRAIEELRFAWPALRMELTLDALSVKREEYLTAALDIWNRYLAEELKDPVQAASALEVMCLLYDD